MTRTTPNGTVPVPTHHPTHHLSEELLLDYAAGSCSEAEALIIATHLALCPLCRAVVEDFDAVGGALLEEIAPTGMDERSLQAVLARLDDVEPMVQPMVEAAAVRPMRGHDDIVVPEPLRSYMTTNLASVAWKPVMRGLDEAPVPVCASPAKSRLMRIGAGVAVPRHTHHGSELTLVLAGGFSDNRGHFVRGDIAVSDPEVEHRPVADADEDCICFVVTDAPLKLTGPIGRLLNPFIRF